jgi:hypothetical protein
MQLQLRGENNYEQLMRKKTRKKRPCSPGNYQSKKKVEFRCKIISEREGRKLHNSELHNLYFSSNVIRMMKSWRVRRT